jgi:acetyl esterase/lipase
MRSILQGVEGNLLERDSRLIFPRVVMQVAGFDPLRDEALAYAERLKAEGIPIELHTYQGLPHCFYMLGSLPQSAKYYENVINFVKKLAA